MPTQLFCTVTNDLTYDQRMIRICSTLAEAGFTVTLIGRKRRGSLPLQARSFQQKRFRCFFNKGKLFYIEYNFRLFWWLLFARFDGICAVDLDTILPAFYVSRWRGKVCLYDAHEYFSEVPEVVHRPLIKKGWETVADWTIPHLKYCYTVGDGLAALFTKRYQTPFAVVRNVPFLRPTPTPKTLPHRPTLLYQGALNEGRGIEELLKAVQQLPTIELWLAGEGDLSKELRKMAADLGLTERVSFLGFVLPEQLPALTEQATIGLNLLKNKGLSYYYSLANKAFDYVQAGLPSLQMDFPEYRHLQAQHEVFELLPNLETATIVSAIQRLTEDKAHYARLSANCVVAAQHWHWEVEKKQLLQVYTSAFAEQI